MSNRIASSYIKVLLLHLGNLEAVSLSSEIALGGCSFKLLYKSLEMKQIWNN